MVRVIARNDSDVAIHVRPQLVRSSMDRHVAVVPRDDANSSTKPPHAEEAQSAVSKQAIGRYQGVASNSFSGLLWSAFQNKSQLYCGFNHATMFERDTKPMRNNTQTPEPAQPPRRKWGQTRGIKRLWLLCGLLAIPLSTMSLQAQPDKIETLPRRTERLDGVPFNTPICAKVDDDYFQAPAVWFRDMKPGIVNDIPKVAPGAINGTRIGIRFWLPDLRVLEGVEYMGTQHAPRENGRPKPGPDQRVVGIGYLGKIAEPARDHMYFYVEKKIRELNSWKENLNLIQKELNFSIKNIHNLIFIHNELINRAYIYSDYDQIILIRGFCSLGDGGYCQAEFNYKGRAEKFFTRFDSKDIAHWALIADGTQKLFDGWKVPFCDGKTVP